jgi:hypothetical protein
VSRYRAPKGIAAHPGVLECDDGVGGGSDYRHDVLLREGWQFKRGRMAGCRTGFFHTVADFRDAEPERVDGTVTQVTDPAGGPA